jgi:hypothetical protein
VFPRAAFRPSTADVRRAAILIGLLAVVPLVAGVVPRDASNGPFFVMAATFRSKASAQAEARANGGWVLRTDLYRSLTPGLFAVVHGPYSRRTDAEAELAGVLARQPEAYVRSGGTSILPAALGDPALLAALLGEVTTQSAEGSPGAPCAPNEAYTSIRMMGPGGDMLGAFQVIRSTGEVRPVRPCG